ncbi:hypothetical protein Slin15195_G089270 [Septoria linicola]|uniref:Secreted protein n=1 Tax=Septoria linicola TaxID=215465 RepID=A0A9Q9ENL8_9PEZI|nr:hypothetical protein Slin14017_G091920 [Septoria linicola]USW55608.1 hypothetical protein Slin15195_G089270 [Septoria linicola]
MVQVSALFTALAMAASVAAEGCYTGGEPFGDALAAVKQHIYNMCHGYSGNRGALQDTWFKGYNESPYPASVCVNLEPFNRRLNVEVTNQWNSGRTLSQQACANNLIEMTGCLWGGIVTKNGFQFKVDPNQGYC